MRGGPTRPTTQTPRPSRHTISEAKQAGNTWLGLNIWNAQNCVLPAWSWLVQLSSRAAPTDGAVIACTGRILSKKPLMPVAALISSGQEFHGRTVDCMSLFLGLNL